MRIATDARTAPNAHFAMAPSHVFALRHPGLCVLPDA